MATWSVAAFASSDLGYLPRVGPVPLRLAAVLRISTNHFVLPIPATVKEPAPVIPKVVKPSPLPVSPPLEPVPVIKETPNAQTFPEAPADGVVSAQMLLKYFNKSGNGTTNANASSAAIDFTPPKPVVPASNGKDTVPKTP